MYNIRFFILIKWKNKKNIDSINKGEYIRIR